MTDLDAALEDAEVVVLVTRWDAYRDIPLLFAGLDVRTPNVAAAVADQQLAPLLVAGFVLLALAFSRMAGAIGWIKKHYVWVMRIGGGMLILVGILLVTGLWTEFTIWLRVTMPGFTTPL